VTSRIRTALDLAAFEWFEQAVTVFDHVLRPVPHGLAAPGREELEAGIAGNYTAAAALRIRTALGFADPASGSPGESLRRPRMHRLGFKAPVRPDSGNPRRFWTATTGVHAAAVRNLREKPPQPTR
jgi:hypothetical protein